MDIKRTTIIKKFPWLKEKKRQYIISASYEGLICASFLNHFLPYTRQETINKIYLERKKIYSEANYRIKCSFLKPQLIARFNPLTFRIKAL